ncbi:Stc1 domain-containing protein [Cladorrhinum sp. PSN259]|nr:Stc1 domain-containing protein [Cladorrhinum sp. PSN259]
MNRPNNISGTIKCQIGGEYKTRDQFSKRALEKYSRALKSGSATRENSSISCNRHTPGQNDEIKCQGPCGQWKARGGFSKSTLKRGKHWCYLCTDWQLRTEAGESLAPPGSEITDDDRRPDAAVTAKDTLIDFEDNDDTRSLVLTAATIGGAASTVSVSASVDIDPYRHLTGRIHLSPPHLRPAGLRPQRLGNSHQGFYTWSEEDGAYEKERSTTTGPSSTTGGPSSAGRPNPAPAPGKAPIPFTAYGPQGQRISMVREPSVISVQSRTTATTATAPEPVRVSRSGWAKPPSRKTAPQVPAYLEEGFVNNGFDDYDGDSPDEL